MRKMTVCNDRIVYLDVLRILAAVAVVVIHVSSQNWRNTDINSLEWNVFNIYDSLARWAVLIFTMISGALFLNINQTIYKIFSKNILRITIAFAFWSWIYAMLIYLPGDGIKSFIKNFLYGPYHMGYLFIIIGLYMISPCLTKIIECDYLTKYFLILALIFDFIIPQGLFLLSFVSEEISLIAKGVIGQFDFHFTLGYVAYFVGGAYLSKKNIEKRIEKIIYALGTYGFVSTILFTIIFSNYQQKAIGAFYGYFTVNVLFESIAVFVFFKIHCSLKDTSDKIKFKIQKLAKYSFGAYLVHALIIDELNKSIGWNTMSICPLISVPLNVIVVSIISFGISGILNHIPILKHYIV